MAVYIAVEGLIGVGKTTLCHLLAAARGARLVLEPAAHNPFLEPFYRDPQRFAFPAQMAYLIQRWRQQQDLRQLRLFDGWVASDYLFDKDRLFAERTLAPDELALYDRFVEALDEVGPPPDLVVWLDAPTPVCLGRIARRAAPGEEAIDAAYLETLRAGYRELLGAWTACPVLRMDTADLDLAEDPDDRAAVLARIERALSADPDPRAAGPLFGEP